MESFFARFKNALVLILLLLAQAIGLATQVRRPANPGHPDGAHVRLVRIWALALISPFERAATWSGHAIRATWANYLDLRHVRQQNHDLQQQIAGLKLQRAQLAEDALEGERLRALVAFRAHYVTSTVAAQVIGTSGSDQSRLLTLDKGSDQGLHPDLPVITPDGAVGKLRDVASSTAQLLLLNDPTAGAGVLLGSTRVRAVVHGDARGRLVITNLTADSRLHPGEQVLTSGGDQVFPRGIPVGTIESIAPDPDHQPYTLIVVHPAASLTRLDEVLVITGTAPSLDPETQQELAADAAQHAADISAAKLPSLHSDSAPTSDATSGDNNAPPPENSTQLVPHPQPALHPDRYSPGSTLPAVDLHPGAPRPATDTPPAEPPPAQPPPTL